MHVKDILSQISAPKGATSIINGMMEGDYSVFPHTKGITASVEQAKSEVSLFKQQLNDCKSDWAYWSILGDLTYWEAVRNILQGAALIGEDNMPDVKFESKEIMVMDIIGDLEKFGEDVLAKCHVIRNRMDLLTR